MILQLPPMLPREDRVRQHNPEIYGNSITTYRSIYTEYGESVPQLLLVEQPEAGSTLLPHYHASDQFQVFIDGNGQLGKHDLNPVAVHYTNKYTGYGPIIAGATGVSYYVFRPSSDPLGAGQYVHQAEARERLKEYRGRRRMLMADGISIMAVNALEALTALRVNHLFRVDDNAPDAGTFAEVVCMGPRMSYNLADPHEGGGQVVLVLAGSLNHSAEVMPPRSAIAVTREEAAISLQAGARGAQVLIMQYPRPHD